MKETHKKKLLEMVKELVDLQTKPTLVQGEVPISDQEKERISNQYSRENNIKLTEKLMVLYGYVMALEDEKFDGLQFDKDGSLFVKLRHEE